MIPNIYSHIEVELPPTEKLVYLALCIRANSKGKAWPSISQLIRDTGLGRSTLYRTLDSLLESGVIQIDKQTDKQMRNKCYTLQFLCSPAAGQSVPERDISVPERDKKVPERDSYIEEDTIKDTLNVQKGTLPASPEIKHNTQTVNKLSGEDMDVSEVMDSIKEYTDEEVAAEVIKYEMEEGGDYTLIPTKGTFRRFVLKMLKRYRYQSVSVIDLTGAETKFIENFRQYAGERAVDAVIAVFSNWIGFASWLEANTKAYNTPNKPDVKYFQYYRNEILEFAKAKAEKAQPKKGDGEPVRVIW